MFQRCGHWLEDSARRSAGTNATRVFVVDCCLRNMKVNDHVGEEGDSKSDNIIYTFNS